MKNEFLRHNLSSINYRFKKSVKYAAHDFGDYTLSKGSISPIEIINHMYQVLNGARIYILKERRVKIIPEKLKLKIEIERFNMELKQLDQLLGEKDLSMNYSK